MVLSPVPKKTAMKTCLESFGAGRTRPRHPGSETWFARPSCEACSCNGLTERSSTGGGIEIGERVSYWHLHLGIYLHPFCGVRFVIMEHLFNLPPCLLLESCMLSSLSQSQGHHHFFVIVSFCVVVRYEHMWPDRCMPLPGKPRQRPSSRFMLA